MSEGNDGHIYKAAGIIIRDRNLLVERSKNKSFFIAPGGSIETGETAKQALVRELKEEFSIEVKEEDLVNFGNFEAPAAGQEHNVVHMQVFTVSQFKGEPTPSMEVEKIAWVTSKNDQSLPLGSIFEHEVIPRLKKSGEIN
jgi:8-oxo-dGTP diphosphatase